MNRNAYIKVLHYWKSEKTFRVKYGNLQIQRAKKREKTTKQLHTQSGENHITSAR